MTPISAEPKRDDCPYNALRVKFPPRIAALLFALAVAPAHLHGQPSPPPDVLFISIDDLNDWVGPLDGHPQAKTPNMDRLAERGMVFTNAHSTSAMCNPARTALMTGLSAATTGVYVNQPDWRTMDVFQDIRTLPGHFQDAGYTTLGAGKLFHSSTFNAWAYYGYNDTTAWDAYYPSLERQIPDEIRPHDLPANGNPLTVRVDWAPIFADDRAMGDGQVAAWSVRQLLTETDGPRFDAVGIYRPHLPWYLPQEYFDLYPLDTVELPPVLENDLDDISEIARMQGAATGLPMDVHEWALEAGVWKDGVQAYLASVSFADAMMGLVLDALERSGRQENTIIVLFSDHGFHLGEKARWRKQTLWRETTRIPLILVAPGVTQAGSRSDVPVSLLDIYPTLTELAGLPTPQHMEGVSLVPLLDDPEATLDRKAVVTTYGYRNHAVSSDRYRYIVYSDGSEELYDLETDPHEWTNRAADPALADVRAGLREWLPQHDEPDARGQQP